MVSTEEVGDIFVLRVDAVRLDSAVGTIIRNAVVSKLDLTQNSLWTLGLSSWWTLVVWGLWLLC